MTEPTLRTSAEMLDRMEALLRRMAALSKRTPLPGQPIEFLMSQADRDYEEAAAIVAMLPEPVDPDIQLSREIAAEAAEKTGCGPDYCQYMCDGAYDDNITRIAAFDALKRGRELASA